MIQKTCYITIMRKPSPPESEQALLSRAHNLAGLTIQALALWHHQTIPPSLHQAKGFVGQLIEHALGVVESNLPEPDFPNLGIELKTIPIDNNGLPRESTYICTAPLNAPPEVWKTSRVRAKLARVLWVPIESTPTIPLEKRRIGTPLLWSPSPIVETILKNDWLELSSMIHFGEIEKISAHLGTYLQIRPKAAHSRILSQTLNESGEEIVANPKGFYLRTILTRKILEENYCLER